MSICCSLAGTLYTKLPQWRPSRPSKLVCHMLSHNSSMMSRDKSHGRLWATRVCSDYVLGEASAPVSTRSREFLALYKLAQFTATMFVCVAEFHGMNTIVDDDADVLLFFVLTL